MKERCQFIGGEACLKECFLAKQVRHQAEAVSPIKWKERHWNSFINRILQFAVTVQCRNLGQILQEASRLEFIEEQK